METFIICLSLDDSLCWKASEMKMFMGISCQVVLNTRSVLRSLKGEVDHLHHRHITTPDSGRVRFSRMVHNRVEKEDKLKLF